MVVVETIGILDSIVQILQRMPTRRLDPPARDFSLR